MSNDPYGSKYENDEEEEVSLSSAIAGELKGTPWYMGSLAVHSLAFLILLLLCPIRQDDGPPRKIDITLIETPVIDEVDIKPDPEPDPQIEPDEKIPEPSELAQVDIPLEIPSQMDEVADDVVAPEDPEQITRSEQLAPTPMEWMSLDSPNASNPLGRPNPGENKGRLKVCKIVFGPTGEKGNPPAVVDRALKWLAAHQESDGHWDCSNYGGGDHDVAVTSMAALAMLADGHSPEYGRYRRNLRMALQWLMDRQTPEGRVGPHRYEAAFSTMALTEAYAMCSGSWRRKLRKSAQAAVHYAASTQCPAGGWDYEPRSQRNDTSVTGWWVMALKSAKVGGLDVNTDVFSATRDYMRAATNSAGRVSYAGKYATVADVKAGGGSPRMSAVSLTCLRFLGCERKDEKVQACVKAVGKLQLNPKEFDFYQWYYQGLGLFQMGHQTPEWKSFVEGVKGAVIPTQISKGSVRDLKGSWNPDSDHYGSKWGRVGQTALGSLMLTFWRFSEI